MASAPDSIAIGHNAIAGFANSVSIGTSTRTTRANQVAVGSAFSTYTFAGVASDASRAAQSGPLQVVTTDAGGNVAGRTAASLDLATGSDIRSLQSQIDVFGQATAWDIRSLQSQINNLGQRDRELASGIAIATSLGPPVMMPGQTFALRAGWADFDGFSAVSVSGAGVLARGYAGRNSSVVVDGGVGVAPETNMVAGRIGVTFGW